jgi:heme A synthase
MTGPVQQRQRVFSWVSWATIVYTLGVIAFGTIVRATGSGDGCGSSWPFCGPDFVPLDPSAETLIEFSHRASSAAAGVLVAGLLLLSLWAFDKGHIVRKAAAVSLVLMIIEGLLGAALVLGGWVDDDISIGRLIAVSLHLANTFLLLGALTLTAWWGSGGSAPSLPIDRKKLRWLVVGGVTLIVIGASGALNAIGVAVFPTDISVAELENEFGSLAPVLHRLRAVHPVIAVVGGMYVAWIAMKLSGRATTKTQRLSAAVAIIVFSQMFVGIANVFFLAPLALQVTHLMVADILWIVFVVFGASLVAEVSDVSPEVHAL